MPSGRAEEKVQLEPHEDLEGALDACLVAEIQAPSKLPEPKFEALRDAYVVLKHKVRESPESFHVGEGGAGPLLHKVAHDLRVDAIRARVREVLTEQPDPSLGDRSRAGGNGHDLTFETANQRFEIARYIKALAAIRAATSNVSPALGAVAGRRLAGRPFASIALELGIREETARQRWRRFVCALPDPLQVLAKRYSAGVGR
jgi:DNA-directed RNA polymerase specialized sigma24 family protein